MKKIIIILLMIPIIINASSTCDYKTNEKYIEYGKNITYSNDYSLNKKSYTLTIYNVLEELIVNYNGKRYRANEDNEVIISNIYEGEKIDIKIYTDGCEESPMKLIYLDEPYYNEFYDTSICNGYKNVLKVCSSKFTTYKVTQKDIENQIYNYNNAYKEPEKKEEIVEKEKSFLQIVIDTTTKYGIKAGIFLLTTLLSTLFYRGKLSKMKHGI